MAFSEAADLVLRVQRIDHRQEVVDGEAEARGTHVPYQNRRRVRKTLSRARAPPPLPPHTHSPNHLRGRGRGPHPVPRVLEGAPAPRSAVHDLSPVNASCPAPGQSATTFVRDRGRESLSRARPPTRRCLVVRGRSGSSPVARYREGPRDTVTREPDLTITLSLLLFPPSADAVLSYSLKF